ncbi:uncharacterized protein LOC144631556 isoform X3 [Oculina patagonica]
MSWGLYQLGSQKREIQISEKTFCLQDQWNSDLERRKLEIARVTFTAESKSFQTDLARLTITLNLLSKL